MANTLTVSLETRECELVISRIIKAPRELVFDAFTKAEHLARWFGPRIFSTEVKSDPQVGGTFRLSMYGHPGVPDEMKGPFSMKGEYLEFERPSKLVYTTDMTEHPESWKQMVRANIREAGDVNYLHGVVTITFEPIGTSTELTIRSNFDSNVVRDAFIKLQMAEGWSESLERLEELVTGDGIDREIVVMRLIKAPRELVYQAFTDSKHLDKWWGPNGFTTSTTEFDFEEGGCWKHIMHGPDGSDYPNWSHFDTIIPNEIIAYDHGGGDADGVNDAQFHATITFESLGDNTRVIMRSVFPNAASRNHVIEKYGALEGGKEHLANLEEYVLTHLIKA